MVFYDLQTLHITSIKNILLFVVILLVFCESNYVGKEFILKILSYYMK